MRLTLYSTSACHLCEQAQDLIDPLLGPDLTLEVVDISDSDELIERYGVRIPVLLRQDNGAEIGWPFDSSGLRTFLR